jgi:hypothetical protein
MLMALWISLGFSWFAYDDYLSRKRPGQPHPENGQRYSHVAGWRKATVYVTALDLIIFGLLPAMSGVFAVTTFVLNSRWRVIAE